MQVISRHDAIESGLIRYFTGNKCKHGHISERLTLSGACVQCNYEFSRLNRKKTKEIREQILAKSLEEAAV